MKKIYLVTYDITHNKLRNQVVKSLRYAGLYRIQKSVFMGPSTPEKINELENWFQQHINLEKWPNDHYVILELTQTHLKTLRIIAANDQLDWKKILNEHIVYFF